MQIETACGSYRWIEDWVKVSADPSGKTDRRTHGIVASRSGNIILFHQGPGAVATYSLQGELLRSWGDFPGAHGMTLVEEDGVEFLWLVDEVTHRVVKATLDGEIVQSLPAPAHAAYAEGKYIPTWVAVNEQRFGGNGDLWLADGYGSHLVHRFDAGGRLLQTLDGTEGAGRFGCPHGVSLDARRGEPEFYVADRGNRRFQVYGGDGKFRRVFGDDFLTSPDMAAPLGAFLVVPELMARLSILDRDDRLIAQIGLNDEVSKQAGWPDNREWVAPGRFNSPHGAAADASGNIYVAEWIRGGRVTKLEKTG